MRKGRWVPAGPLIAIIDDDESMRKALVALVRSAGYVGHCFTSAVEFLANGTVSSFACIVTDIQMPGMSGIELK
jgi:FixJ family two-component response regulator